MVRDGEGWNLELRDGEGWNLELRDGEGWQLRCSDVYFLSSPPFYIFSIDNPIKKLVL